MPSIRVIMGVVRWVVLSLVVHALVLYLLAPRDEQLQAWHPPALPHVEVPQPMTIVELVSPSPEPSSGGGKTGVVARRGAPKRSADAWERVAIRTEGSSGGGHGNGEGTGNGNGIGFGNGGSVRGSDDVPAPPAAPKISKARRPQLIWPTRNDDVDDESNLFVARVSLNRYGEVVGAHMLTKRPGAKADRAANVIWTFRYTPALDDDGMPVNSTLDQEFQIR